MPTISIVTPVYNGGHHHLLELYECLCAQEMPPGWGWQWVVQEDGTSGVPTGQLPTDDPRISTACGRAGRAAMARTVALTRARGVLTRAIDADDVVTPGSLWRDIETLTAHPSYGWCVSACVDLHPDGSLTPGPFDPPAGPLAPGTLLAGHRAGKLQVMGTTMCAYTDLIHAVGGWQAVPSSEDVALLLACEAVADGWMISDVSEIYRKRAVQTVTDPEYMDPAEKAARDGVVFSRADALGRTGWRWTPPRGALIADAWETAGSVSRSA